MSGADGNVVDVVPDALDGERLDRAVALMAGVSRSVAARLVADGRVRVAGRVVTAPASRLSAGDELAVELPPPVDARPTPDPSVVVDLVHVDDDLIIVDKPAGLVVHPGHGHTGGTLVHGLLARFPELADVGEPHRPGIVHRLDRGTSGLLAVARTAEAHRRLTDAFAQRRAGRIYLALAWGAPETEAGTVEAPVGRSNRHPTRMTVTTRGRDAVTHYRVLARSDRPRPVALLRCRLETGRTHQIRVHLAAIGHPVVGDRDYGGARPGLDPGRPFLHAAVLRVPHPRTGETIEAVSPLPAELVAVAASCGIPPIDPRRLAAGD
ncbi:MAG: RluA family pseudouridine synthase [Actinomyces sp.]|nr:MAG: RluA family pseudouridine synthase [Actinomyces sp.]